MVHGKVIKLQKKGISGYLIYTFPNDETKQYRACSFEIIGEFEYKTYEDNCNWFVSDSEIHEGSATNDKGVLLKNIVFSNNKTTFSATNWNGNKISFTKIDDDDHRLSEPTAADFVGTWKTETANANGTWTISYKFTYDIHENGYGYFTDIGICSDSTKSYSKPSVSWNFTPDYTIVANEFEFDKVCLSTNKRSFIGIIPKTDKNGKDERYYFYKQ